MFLKHFFFFRILKKYRKCWIFWGFRHKNVEFCRARKSHEEILRSRLTEKECDKKKKSPGSFISEANSVSRKSVRGGKNILSADPRDAILFVARDESERWRDGNISRINSRSAYKTLFSGKKMHHVHK